MEAQARIRRALNALVAAAPDTVVKRPPTAKRLAFLVAEAGLLAPELDAYFAVCDGVALPAGGELFSIDRTLNFDAPGHFALGHDGEEHYRVVVAGTSPVAGAVLSWGLETNRLELLHAASSIAAHIELLVESQIARSAGHEDPTDGRWPDDAAFMASRDPQWAKLAAGPDLQAHLDRPIEVEFVDYKGVSRERKGINPFTKQPMTFPALPRRRRKR